MFSLCWIDMLVRSEVPVPVGVGVVHGLAVQMDLLLCDIESLSVVAPGVFGSDEDTPVVSGSSETIAVADGALVTEVYRNENASLVDVQHPFFFF